ncbi:carboxypeptidase C [Trametes versicolor FP-101664 SS1]|uniref:carboxypeptidase C n=1 Tax=Trametes versicolor (strain FP-101664) TaxID=717944 RepID=UPI0004622B83|nr:carboxypeptidase C [Trametes versicolor FP-101664 SS1]EIW55989.1 carboxypeptidase C [Trametes versicolor FP-101664 SS1]
MKLLTTSALSLLAATAVLAVPTSDQVILDGLSSVANEWKDVAHDILREGKQRVTKWVDGGKEFVQQHGLTYELVSHPAFDDHHLRMTKPALCDTAVKQVSGYLDIADDKHLFYWFFEARSNPEKAPLVLWLNGGPGCSSTTGLLFELGPCRIAEEGKNVSFHPHSWTEKANVIFLDQPVNVGYSYADGDTSVNTTPVAAEDVWAFLELFLTRFPQYAGLPFHIAAESYGGMYAPSIASVVHHKNLDLAKGADALAPGLLPINLASVIIGNGISDPYVQMASVPDAACEGEFPVFSDPQSAQCQALRTKVPTCQRLIKSCYDFDSKFTCTPALLYCNSQLMGPIMQTGRNVYDVRRECDRERDGQLCYQELTWIDTWMNLPETKRQLGVNPALDFASCNMDVNQAFALQGDGARNRAKLLPELVESGIRLLIYAGDADMACNYIGNERWVEKLENKFHDEFASTTLQPWVTLDEGKLAGWVRSAGGDGFTAGNLTYVQVHAAGHMVPFDQPEAALDLISRWLEDVPLVLN